MLLSGINSFGKNFQFYISADKIKFIKTPQGISHARGVLNGLLTGVVAGAVFGILAKQFDSNKSSKPTSPSTPGCWFCGGINIELPTGAYVAAGLVITVPICSLVGLLAGKRIYKKYEINGSKENFDYLKDEIIKDLEIDPRINAKKFNQQRVSTIVSFP